MTSRIGLIVIAVLVSPAPASAQVDGPAMPPAPASTLACKPTKRTVCGPAGVPGRSVVLRSA